jgi:hypothetical protein
VHVLGRRRALRDLAVQLADLVDELGDGQGPRCADPPAADIPLAVDQELDVVRARLAGLARERPVDRRDLVGALPEDQPVGEMPGAA